MTSISVPKECSMLPHATHANDTIRCCTAQSCVTVFNFIFQYQCFSGAGVSGCCGGRTRWEGWVCIVCRPSVLQCDCSRASGQRKMSRFVGCGLAYTRLQPLGVCSGCCLRTCRLGAVFLRPWVRRASVGTLGHRLIDMHWLRSYCC